MHTKTKKLDPKCAKGIFIGYDINSPAYLVFYPEDNRVLKHRLIRFISNGTNHQTQIYPTGYYYYYYYIPQKKYVQNNTSATTPDPQIKTTETQDNALTDEDGKLRHYLRKKRKPPEHLNDYITNSEDDSDHALINFDYCYKATCSIPRTYREAIESSDPHCWVDVMHEELESLEENDVFELTYLPEGKKTVGSKWVYTNKENPDGSKRYKARFVARWFKQRRGIDYGETFSPTANITSIRILMQMVVQYDLIVHQMDVKTAYLHAPIDYEIFVEQPEGFKTHKLVYRLNKSLYGLKQSGRNWNKMLHECLIRNDFIQNPADHCVYMK